MPGGHTGLWEGEKIDDKMIMRRTRIGINGENLEDRLTFYAITEKSFVWKGEVWNLDNNTGIIDWKIRAKRN